MPILFTAVLLTAGFAAFAEEESKIVARVDGSPVTEADVARAQAEIGQHIANAPAEDRRQLLIDYVINSRLLANAGEKAGLDQSQAFKDSLDYYRQRALKDLFLEEKIRGAITEAEARKVYDEQMAKHEPEIELRARHVLVPTEEAARGVAKRVAEGEDFAKLASAMSQDPGSAAKGGDLGYFTKEQMVGPFAEAAFALEPGRVSQPVQTQFGWHIIKVEDKRRQAPPSFEDLKDQIIALLTSRKTGETIRDLRNGASIEMLDAKASTDATKPEDAPKPQEAPKQ